MKRIGFIDGRRIKFLDDFILYFGTDKDISMKWDGDKLEMLPAAIAQQVNFGSVGHVIYLKLEGSLAITGKEFSVTMAGGDPAALITQQAFGPGLRVNRQTTQAGYLVDFQVDGTSAFWVDGDTKIVHSTARIKAASFGIEPVGEGVSHDGINVYDQGTITTFTMDVHGGIIIAFTKES